MIIDATNLILGRLGSFAAKRALLGEKIDIINCEKAVITGRKAWAFAEFRRRNKQGTFKGPFLYKKPDRFVKRAIRGMLPYKREAGKNAFKSIKCYMGIPETLGSQKAETIDGANISKMSNTKYTYIGDICRKLGAKI